MTTTRVDPRPSATTASERLLRRRRTAGRRAVQLPARQDRLHEPPLTRVDAILDCLEQALGELSPLPTAIFGHSFGALVAFELARRLTLAERPPIAVVVAARRSPHIPESRALIHKLGDESFCARMIERYGATASYLQDVDLRAMTLPPLRADFEALETYAYREASPLDCPLTVLCGRQDPSTSVADARAWGAVAKTCTVHELDAGHFFLDTDRSWVLQRVVNALKLE